MAKSRLHRDLILVIDQGGHASRTQIVDQSGDIHGYGEVAISASHNADGHIEYNPESMLASLLGAIKKATGQVDKRRILAAALATQRSNVICWHRETGQALSPIISWQDRRAHEWLAKKQDQATFVHNRTGLFMSAHYGASKLHWCITHINAVRQASLNNTLTWGPMASWLTSKLCRERPCVCDPVNASRTLLWSLQQQDWSPELLQLFELPDYGLPDCCANHYHFGNLDIEGHDIPLQLVTGDQAAALYAFGHPQTDNAYITAGTGGFVLNPCGQQAIIDEQLLSSIVLLDQNGPHFVHEGTVNGAGSALDYYAIQFGQSDYIHKFNSLLTHPGNPPLFLNGFSGLGTPFMRAQFQSRFIGEGDEINSLLAVIESIVFLLQANLERMQQLNPSLQRIIIGGGLARFDGFCQRLADMGMPVIRPAQTETTSQGLAFLLFHSLGKKPDLNNRLLACNSYTFTPQNNPALTRRYQQWRCAMKDALQHE